MSVPTSPEPEESSTNGSQPGQSDRFRRGRWFESIHRFERFVTGESAQETQFVNLNEVLHSAKAHVQTTAASTSKEWYYSPDSIGKDTSHPRVIHEVDTAEDGNNEQPSEIPQPQGPIRRQETIQSTSTLIGSGDEAESETITQRTKIGYDEDNDSDAAEFFAMSPILGARRLPSLYDTGLLGSSEKFPEIPRFPLSRGIPHSYSFPNIPRRKPVPSSDNPPSSHGGRTPAGPTTESATSISPDTTSTDAEDGIDTPQPVSEQEQPPSSQGVVEPSVLLQVSVVNRSGIHLPIAVDSDGDHSTLEYLQVIETASYRQYAFSDNGEDPNQGGLLQRSKSTIRRMLSARNKFITARTRSFMRKLQREVDLEMQNPSAAWQLREEVQTEPAELDGMEAMPGPHELTVSPTDDHWGQWGARPQLFRDGTFTKSQTLSRMCCALFGRNLPRELTPMCKVYMEQLDIRLSEAMKNFELQTPNTLNWPRPLEYLVGCLKVVASKMEGSLGIEDFVTQNFAYLMTLIQEGPAAAADRDNNTAQEKGKNNIVDQKYIRLANEWMLFCLESWTMLDMTAVCKNRHDLRLSENFCKSPLKDTIDSLLPRFYQRYNQYISASHGYQSKSTQIFPREMTAQMLQELGGVEFVWTNDISKHLTLDTKKKTVKLYSHIVFAYLHAEAGTESSLNKAGLLPYHHILTELTESYRLLFGSNDRSRKIFSTIDPAHRSTGYFDPFNNLPSSYLDSTKPKWLYNTSEDFPIFGDRLIELRGLLKPKGLSGLWRDTRDTLQWWTFWAVVVIGGVSLFLGIVQMGLGAVQAYASVMALKQG